MTIRTRAVPGVAIILLLVTPRADAAQHGQAHAPARHAPAAAAATPAPPPARTEPDRRKQQPAAAKPRDEHSEFERAVMRIVEEIKKPGPAAKKIPSRAGAAAPAADPARGHAAEPARIKVVWRARLSWPSGASPPTALDGGRVLLTWR